MEYIIVSEYDNPLVQRILESIARRYVDGRPPINDFKRDLKMGTKEENLTKIVDKDFDTMSTEDM